MPIHIEIAGISFAVHCPEVPVLPERWSCYRTFEGPPREEPGGLRVELGVEVGHLPELDGLEKLFEGESWSLFRRGEGYCFALAPRGPGLPPPWVTCVDSTFTRGTIHCDEVLVRDNNGVRGIINPILHRLDQLLVMYILAEKGGILLHAAGVVLDGRAWLFAGRSGAGKTTLARLFAAAPGIGEQDLLSDDRMVIREEGNGLLAYGTPWAGDALIALNRSAPLGGIFFIHHGKDNRVVEVTRQAAVEKMLPLTSIPWYDPSLIEKITGFCEKLAGRTTCRDLHFTPTARTVDFLRRAAGGMR